ncbi:MAG: HD domain-containing protein [Bacilli bacterium]|nr:HD domain-containing protein [Bacilli bacterium]
MIEEFNKYVSNYDLNNKDIRLKYNHSFRVMELSEKYANLLGLYEEDVKLAKTIGLLHDIGRFEQLAVYHTYNDSKSIDHADYSVEQLFDKGEIKRFYKNKNHWDIIRLAIKNHNKFAITGVSDDRCLLHCHLIRDTDKLDILYNWSTLHDIFPIDEDIKFSSNVITSIRNHESVKKEDIKNPSDRNACFMAFIFDIHFDECVSEAYNYIKKVYKELKYKEIYKEAMEIIDNYVKERIGDKTC